MVFIVSPGMVLGDTTQIMNQIHLIQPVVLVKASEPGQWDILAHQVVPGIVNIIYSRARQNPLRGEGTFGDVVTEATVGIQLQGYTLQDGIIYDFEGQPVTILV